MFKVAFTGDIAFTGFFSDKCSQQVIDNVILNYLNNSDYVVANVETPITSHPTLEKKVINIVSSPKMANNLVSMNMRIWNLCNNHADDCGILGMKDSVTNARKHDCIPLGIGDVTALKYPEPLIIGDDECRVGIVSITNFLPDYPFLFTLNKKEIFKETFFRLKKEVNYIIAIFHSGREFSTMPTANDRKVYMQALDMGADIVVAHHPHVIQNYETVGNKIIFYSLGNFIFDIEYQRRFNYTDIGLLLRINFTSNGFKWDYLPTRLDREKEFISAMDLKDTPNIFRDIQNRDYVLMFPLAAKFLLKNEKKIEGYIEEHKKSDNNKAFAYRIKERYRKIRKFLCRYKSMLRICSAFSWLYKLSNHSDLYDYISNS